MKFVLNIIRKFFSWLDVVVYKCVAIIFQLIVDLANVQIFTDSTINEFANRMYIILGLIMLFKIMISFIQILIDPDTISDKEKGAGNILKRVTISLALIALVPSIFKFAREVQGYIVPVIPRVILGINDRATTTRYDENGNEITSESDVDVVNESNIGDTVAWQSFLPFFNYNEGCEDGSLKLNSGYSDENLSVFSVGSASYHVNDTCSESQDENGYKYDYTFLISTAVGVYLLFILIQVAVAIAVRAIKLGICEFVAPIPIASYVDPKTSKSTFDKWVSTSVKVYLDLFTRLIIVYFVVYIMIVIFGDPTSITKIYENVGKDWFRTTLVILFLIIGLFKFVKEAPKFISGLLGLKTDGDIGNMFKDAWGAFTTTGRAIGGTADVLQSNFLSQKERAESQGVGKFAAGMAGIGSAIAGAAGFNRRLVTNRISGKKGKDLVKNSYQGTIDARNRRAYNADVVFTDGYTPHKYRKERRRQNIGVASAEDFEINRNKSFSQMFNTANAAAKHGMGKIYDKPGSLSFDYQDGAGNWHNQTLAEVQSLSKRLEGQTYDGKVWTNEDVSFWNDNLKRAENEAQYVLESNLLGKGDSAAVQNWHNTKEAMLSNFDLFRSKIDKNHTAFDVFASKYNENIINPNEEIHSIDDLSRLLNSDGVNQKISAKQLRALKAASEEMQTVTGPLAVAAQKRKESYNQAAQNNQSH